MKNVLIFAHRGASGYAPDNTREAFELALKMGANALESDVKLTRDRHLVFFHDMFLKHGIRRCPVSLVSLKRLQAIDLGKGTRVPEVEKIFALFQGRTINWSIDANGKGQGAELVRLAKKYQILDHVLMVNEGYKIKKKWEQAGMPSEQYVWSIRDWQIERFGLEGIVKICRERGICNLNVKLEWMTPELQEALKAADIKFFIWDCHDDQHIKAALSFQPDAIYSNFPDVALKLTQP